MFGPGFFAAWAGIILAAISIPAVALRKLSGGVMSWLAAIGYTVISLGALALLRQQGIKYDGQGQPVHLRLNAIVGNQPKYFGIGGALLFALGSLYALSRRRKRL
ncbi:MAG: hypothetical protein LBK99_08230 [Opitutaceae bacterium]|jgi:hypothetical protein|nr:hypothetical protein [Opitutaceae bacterium]